MNKKIDYSTVVVAIVVALLIVLIAGYGVTRRIYQLQRQREMEKAAALVREKPPVSRFSMIRAAGVELESSVSDGPEKAAVWVHMGTGTVTCRFYSPEEFRCERMKGGGL